MDDGEGYAQALRAVAHCILQTKNKVENDWGTSDVCVLETNFHNQAGLKEQITLIARHVDVKLLEQECVSEGGSGIHVRKVTRTHMSAQSKNPCNWII